MIGLRTTATWIPATVMLVMGVVIFTPFVGALNWIWPLALIGGGAYLILRRPSAEETAITRSGSQPPADITPADITPADITPAESSYEPAVTGTRTEAAGEVADPAALR